MTHIMTFPIGAVRNLLYNLVRRDLTVRYKSTVLGFFWSFVKPLAMTAIFWFVFQYILGLELRREGDGQSLPYALHILTGMLVWNLFAGATGEAMNVILANANLIKKVRLPLVVFPAATVVAQMVHFVLALVVLVGLLIVAGLPPTPGYIWLVPLMLLHFVVTLAAAMMLAALNVFYRDVASIWEVLTTAWFYATPIVYPVWMVGSQLSERGLPDWLMTVYLLNPLAPLVVAYRQVLMYGPAENVQPELAPLLPAMALSAAVACVMLVVGWLVFRRYSRSFADEL